MAESEFAAAKTVDLAVERAAAEFRAKGAGVGLLPHVEHDLGDVRLYDVSFHAYRAAIFGKRVVLRDGSVLEAHINRDGGELELFGGELAVGGERGKQEHAVLAARKPDEDPVAVLDHLVVLNGAPHGREYALHGSII